MLDRPTDERLLTQEEFQHLNRACDAFEVAWQAGGRPSIEEFLAEAPAAVRPELLRELLELEVAYRKRRGEKPTLGEYLRRFPDHLNAAFLAETPLADADSLCLAPAAAAADAPAPPGQTLPLVPPAAGWPAVSGYEIVEILGRGGMGVVYKAKQLAAKRLVALKMIRDGVLAGPQHRVRFRIEAEAAARFQHPNLVRIYEVGEHGGLPYFSMEYAEGGSLDKRLAGQPLPPREAALLVRTLAEAAHYAHEKQVIHRDLKPANVVLTGDGRPLITDFGLAKRLDSDTRVTPSEAVFGTASYMAPEQAEGRVRQIGPATDVYALGAILYEVLTGHPPFRGENVQATIRQVIHDDPAPPTRQRPEVPADLEAVCLKCLEKEPGQRYASARELAEDLARFLAGEAVTAVPADDWERQARWARSAGFEVEDVMTYGVRDVVYKARQVHLNRVVALKVIAGPAPADPAARARLRREAETVALLDHPNIVRIYSSGELRDQTYLAFEFVAGGSLIERFVDRPVQPSEAARLVRQMAEAMHYAHQRGVLHCALKPSNVLLTEDGVPKITNFGLSVLRGQPAAERRLAFRRLPTYMAPELADGRVAEVGPAADVYALGAILYKLLTGGPPFLGETLAETWEQVRSQMPPPPSSVRPDVPRGLDVICETCLAKEPGDRYESAGELAADLAEFLAVDRPAVLPGGGAQPEFPDYQLLRELGRGSMSTVYEARHLPSDRLVALKIMRHEFLYGEPLRALLREVTESVSRLRHPNIVQVYDCGEREGCPYFIMELAPGGSLDQRADRQMPEAAAAALVRTLARTVDTVHRQGIIHGNLKPSKVLLAADGTPKITGFIIAGHQSKLREEGLRMAASAPAVMGKLRYMAPEQLAGDTAAIGPATDVYALGLTLLELLTGWLPSSGAALMELMPLLRREPLQPPRELRPDAPPDLVETICLRCLAKEPERRYPSAGALAEQLDRYLAGQPLPWPPAPAQPSPLAAGLDSAAVAHRRPGSEVLEPGPDRPPLAARPTSGELPPQGRPSPQPGTWARIVAWLTRRTPK
jgi:serine/threonine protein kinase